ncbi:glutamyl-tRNA reductase [Sporolactobacillus kofuensis]|uniref:Glutamyl-tRNA reductase n=1 Tax=Sporolactobacillus kofuensis TaxID=269672 RepID=A0ABW1WH39_9BACL|nr:glutamyl-tRNA reductase [Sporolactobacillus kofuensis]MCO7176118.1 glutamyl-tRNA reductase [Sporolactobacillus kofuensis]
MHILTIGVNHRNTPVDIREQLTFQPEMLEQALTELRETKSIFEDVILSTCNRTELYVICDQLHTGRYFSKKFFADWFHMTSEALMPYLVMKEDQEAIRHLFRVTCGLDSMVLGETQILGQVRTSFLTAQQTGTTGTFFNELFKQALSLAKHAQDETQINDHPVSVSYAAVKLLQDKFGALEDKSVLMIGAGDMSRLALNHLASSGMSHLTVMNRTKSKADLLADQFHGKSAALDAMETCIEQSDIVFTSTSASDFIIDESILLPLIEMRGNRPLILVDIGVPRNIDPAIAQLDHVYLFDIDDLEKIVDSNLEARKKAASQIEMLINEQQEKYSEWLHTLGVVPVISALRRKALSIHSETMKRIENKLPEMTEKERKVISKQAKSMINQLLRDPINNIKELAVCEHGKHAIDHFAEIFNIAEDVDHSPNQVMTLELKAFTKEKDDQSAHQKPINIG